MAPEEKEFLHECLKVKRGRGELNEGEVKQKEERRRRNGLDGRPDDLNQQGEPFRSREKALPTCGKYVQNETHEAMLAAVAELMAATAKLQARENEISRRVSKLEHKALSSTKVASEFHRMWTGMTVMAEKINEELAKARGQSHDLTVHRNKCLHFANVFSRWSFVSRITCSYR